MPMKRDDPSGQNIGLRKAVYKRFLVPIVETTDRTSCLNQANSHQYNHNSFFYFQYLIISPGGRGAPYIGMLGMTVLGKKTIREKFWKFSKKRYF